MERRKNHRLKKRILCELVVGGHRHAAIVRDLSRTGLFVQTNALLEGRNPLLVRLRGPDGSELELEADPVRRVQVPRRLVGVAHGGVGLRIRGTPPEAYLKLLQGEKGVSTRMAAPAGDAGAARRTPGRRFTARLRQAGGVRCRTIVVEATSADEAAARIRQQQGDAWELLSVESREP